MAETGQGQVTITAHESEWRNLLDLSPKSNYAQAYLAKVLLGRIRTALDAPVLAPSLDADHG